MSKSINTQFDYLGLTERAKYDYKSKDDNTFNKISYMFNRSLIMFKYHNLPDSIPYRELERLLQGDGYAIITKVNDKLYAFYGGLGGELDEYYRPTIATIDNPYLKYNKMLKIDDECVLVRNDSNMMGLTPLYAKYCTELTEADITLMLALYNKRIKNFITATDDSTKASADNFIKKIIDGEISVIGTNEIFDSFKNFSTNSDTDKSLTEIYETILNIKSSMYNEIGLSAYNTAKKERISNAELELNSDNLYPLIDDMLENRKEGIEKINSMFGTNIEVELNSSWDYRIYNGMGIHNTKDEIDIKDTGLTENEENAENNTGNETKENNSEENKTEENNNETIQETENE